MFYQQQARKIVVNTFKTHYNTGVMKYSGWIHMVTWIKCQCCKIQIDHLNQFICQKQLFGVLSEFSVPVLYYGYFPVTTIFAHAYKAVQYLEVFFLSSQSNIELY